MFHENLLRPLILAGVLAGGCGSASALSAKVTVSPAPAQLIGTATIRDLAAQAAAAPAARAPLGKPIEMPRPRLPGGSPAAKQSMAAPGALPFLPPNAEVARGPGGNQAAPLAGVIAAKGFVGIHSKDDVTANGFEFEPPDQGLAVHDNVAAEINNLIVRFFNASTGAPLTPPIALDTFFQLNTHEQRSITDTQAFFDPATKRWFFTEIFCIFECQGTDLLGIAVSETSDPLGKYFVYGFIPFSGDLPKCAPMFFPVCFPDYPHAGYDENGFYISVNMFSQLDGTFAGAATYAFSKAQLEAGAGSVNVVRILYPDDFVVQPSVPAPGEPFETAANGTEFLLEARNIVDRSHNVRLWAISNTNNIVSNPSSLRAFAVDVPGEAYGLVVPATEPNVIGPLCKSVGAIAAPFLDAVFNAFQSTIQMAKDKKLYGALPFGSVDGNGLLRDSVAWFALKPSVDATGHPSASIFKQGYVVPPTGYSLLNPAFGLDKSGGGFLGFTITNQSKDVPGGFPSAALIQFTGTAPAGGIIVSGQGIAADDGFTGCSSTPPGGVGRWGDYGAATVDAATGFFYVANENISGAWGRFTNWGTFITQIKTSPPLAAAQR